MQWTDEADALLVRLWDEGGSLAFVARGMAEQGYSVSRNSVAGRKHRLKVSDFHRKTMPPIKTVKPEKPINQPRRRRMTTPKLPPTAKEIDDLKRWEGVDYLDLKPSGCKAILDTRGGPWMLSKVCGRLRCFDGNGNRSSYCKLHMRLYSTPSSQRKFDGQGSKVPRH